MIRTSLLLLAGMFACSSCSDFLEEYSQDKAQVESWEDLNELLLGDGYLQPCRFVLSSSSSSAASEIHKNLDILHFMSDEVKENVGNTRDLLGYRSGKFAFYTWQQDTGVDEDIRYVGGDEAYWDMFYEKINTCNMVLSLIDGQPASREEDVEGKERVKGEAYFLRAAYYFLLANLYAQPYLPQTAASTPGVPIKLSEYVEDREFKRESLATVYAQVLADLEQAEACLQGKERVSAYHADLTATLLLRSRVYLYMQDWEAAAREARRVLELQDDLLDLHSLTPGMDVVYRDSPETIFSMGGYLISVAFADWRGMFGNNMPAYFVSDDMVALFRRGDLRTNLFIGSSQNFRQSPVFLKVNGQQRAWGNYSEVSDCFLLRTPEAYLTLAEASACAGDEAEARRVLETFLETRMETAPSITQTGSELVGLIRDERAREFLLEGHRWFDLRRYTVCQPYPWSKTIEHGHMYYDAYVPLRCDYYRLETNDPAYTLPIPRKVLEFQVSLGDNERPARKPARSENY